MSAAGARIKEAANSMIDPKPMRAAVSMSGSTVGRIFLASTFSTAQNRVAMRIKNSPSRNVNPINPPIKRFAPNKSITAKICNGDMRSFNNGIANIATHIMSVFWIMAALMAGICVSPVKNR